MANLIYVDSCVFLSFLKGESGRADIVQACFDNARDKSLNGTLITSVLSITEVAWVAHDASGETIAMSAIDYFWDDLPISFVEVNEVHAREARNLIGTRASQPPVEPSFNSRRRAADAIHLATALTLQANQFWTYDANDIANYRADGIDILEPTSLQLRLGGT